MKNLVDPICIAHCKNFSNFYSIYFLEIFFKKFDAWFQKFDLIQVFCLWFEAENNYSFSNSVHYKKFF